MVWSSAWSVACATVRARGCETEFGQVQDEDDDMSQTAKTAQRAQQLARVRRLETLPSDRAAKDERIASAAADVFLGMSRRETAQAKAQAEIDLAETSIGDALRRMVAEGVALDVAAKMCGLSGAEVRKLTRRKPATDAGKSNGAPARE